MCMYTYGAMYIKRRFASLLHADTSATVRDWGCWIGAFVAFSIYLDGEVNACRVECKRYVADPGVLLFLFFFSVFGMWDRGREGVEALCKLLRRQGYLFFFSDIGIRGESLRKSSIC